MITKSEVGSSRSEMMFEAEKEDRPTTERLVTRVSRPYSDERRDTAAADLSLLLRIFSRKKRSFTGPRQFQNTSCKQRFLCNFL